MCAMVNSLTLGFFLCGGEAMPTRARCILPA